MVIEDGLEWLGKKNTLSTSAQVFVGGPDDADRTIIRLTSSNKLEVEEYSGSYQFQLTDNFLRCMGFIFA